MRTQKHFVQSVSVLRPVFVLVVLAAAAYIIKINWRTVLHSLQVALHAQLGWTLVALVLMAGTFLLAAGIYMALALHRLRYGQTVLIEVSTAFANRLLPSGIGGLGLHGIYLHRRNHTPVEAATIVSINNLLGIGAHLLLLTSVIAVQPRLLRRFTHGHSADIWIAVGILGSLVIILAVPVIRRKLTNFVRSVGDSLHRMPVRQLLRALCFALALTCTYTLILFAASHAVAVRLDIVQTFVIFSVGMLASSAAPTPGGLVGAEAGLFAGFVSYGVAAAPAGAAVVIYRLTTYWVPLIPGMFALALARKRHLV